MPVADSASGRRFQPFARGGAVSGRTADTAADTVSGRTCDRSADGCIYSAVTSSFFDLQVPQTLIDRACAGELRAFEQIYRRFERPMYTLALRMLGEAEAARDVLHDAMLKAFQRIGNIATKRRSGRGCGRSR